MGSFGAQTFVSQAHSVFGGRPAYVGVNGWHDPGRSDGLSQCENSMRDVMERWAMQDTNYFRLDTIRAVLRGQL